MLQYAVAVLDVSTVPLGGRKSRTLELVAFDKYCRFATSAFFYSTSIGSQYLALYCKRQQKYQNGNIHRKLRVPTSEREGKLSHLRARATRARCMEKIYGKFTETRAAAPRARYALSSCHPEAQYSTKFR
jgi:hypothetical protein